MCMDGSHCRVIAAKTFLAVKNLIFNKKLLLGFANEKTLVVNTAYSFVGMTNV